MFFNWVCFFFAHELSSLESYIWLQRWNLSTILLFIKLIQPNCDDEGNVIGSRVKIPKNYTDLNAPKNRLMTLRMRKYGPKLVANSLSAHVNYCSAINKLNERLTSQFGFLDVHWSRIGIISGKNNEKQKHWHEMSIFPNRLKQFDYSIQIASASRHTTLLRAFQTISNVCWLYVGRTFLDIARDHVHRHMVRTNCSEFGVPCVDVSMSWALYGALPSNTTQLSGE